MTTLKQLKRIGQLLENERLLNDKYLTYKNNNYYFVIKLFNYTFKKSLKTDNFIYSNILKYKILEVIKKIKNDNENIDVLSDLNTTNYQVQNFGGNGLNIVPENEDERKLLSEIEKTIIKKIKLLSKENNVNVVDKETRNTQTLKKSCEDFLNFKSKTVSKKVMIKYKQSVKFLYIFFKENKNIKDINEKECNDLRMFLFEVPTRWDSKTDLKDKDLKLMIEKKMKILDKYEKLSIRSVDEQIVKFKTIFQYFMDTTLIYKNPFSRMKKLNKNTMSDKRNFTKEESSMILKYMLDNKLNEEYNLFKFGLMTGLRRGEILNLKIKNIDFEKEIIDINGTKNDMSKRIMVIHKDLIKNIKEQIKDKDMEDFIFYNSEDYKKLSEDYRKEKIGKKINDIISIVVGKEKKKHLDIHSLRKNFSQILFYSNEFGDLELKTLLGHSTKGDITDNHYLRGKRDYQILKDKINKIDFNDFIEFKERKIDFIENVELL